MLGHAGSCGPYFLQITCSCVPFPECLLKTRNQASRCKVAASCSFFKLGVLFIHVVPSIFSPSLPVTFPSYRIQGGVTPAAVVVLYYAVCTLICACLALGRAPVPFPRMLSLLILMNFSSPYLNLFVRSTMVLFLTGLGAIQWSLMGQGRVYS